MAAPQEGQSPQKGPPPGPALTWKPSRARTSGHRTWVRSCRRSSADPAGSPATAWRWSSRAQEREPPLLMTGRRLRRPNSRLCIRHHQHHKPRH